MSNESEKRDAGNESSGGSGDASAPLPAPPRPAPGPAAEKAQLTVGDAFKLLGLQSEDSLKKLNDMLDAFKNSEAARAIDAVLKGAQHGARAFLESDVYRALQETAVKIKAAMPPPEEAEKWRLAREALPSIDLFMPAPPTIYPSSSAIRAAEMEARVAELEAKVDGLEVERDDREQADAVAANPPWEKPDGDPS